MIGHILVMGMNEKTGWNWEKPGSASGGVAGKMGKIPSLAVALLELYFI